MIVAWMRLLRISIWISVPMAAASDFTKAIPILFFKVGDCVPDVTIPISAPSEEKTLYPSRGIPLSVASKPTIFSVGSVFADCRQGSFADKSARFFGLDRKSQPSSQRGDFLR
jgi:hypothetical protein